MRDLFELDIAWLLVVAFLAALGLWLLVTGFINLLRGRMLRGPLRGAFGAALGALALAISAVGMNLHTYQRLNYEAPVAWLEFERIGPRQYQALIRTPDGRDRVYGVYGDEWQLDAKVLKWKGVGAMLGLDPLFRLERFSGRYTRVADEKHATRSIYGLTEGEPGFDVWSGARRHERWLPFVDTIYGSAAYMPMRDGARYAVLITEDGLIARAQSPRAMRGR